MQGIETVRRDNCQLVRTVVTTCLEMILIEEDEEGAKEYVRNTISDLLMNRLDLSLLVITKVLHFPLDTPMAPLAYVYICLTKPCSSGRCAVSSHLQYSFTVLLDIHFLHVCAGPQQGR